MRMLLIAAAAGFLAAGPGFARQDPAASTTTSAEDAPSHETCKAVMGRKMDGKARHDHARDKTGSAQRSKTRPLTEAEMARMHEQCAEKMRAAEAPTK
ncbi:MAG: hypothetical protein ACK41C_04850 [Phenylobacterium sp.]|uniref:hypothetical protein n=1 Tax=Phenylobacterium sp. TaxID=1871053 RepID=UPI003919B23E